MEAGSQLPNAFEHRGRTCVPRLNRTCRHYSTGRSHLIARLEDLTKGALVSGILADHAVTVVDVPGTAPRSSR